MSGPEITNLGDNLDELVEEASQQMSSVARIRSYCPTRCAEYLNRSLRNEFKILMANKYQTGLENKSVIENRFKNEAELEKLGLNNQETLSLKPLNESMKDLEDQLHHVNGAMRLITHLKQQKYSK